VPPPSSAPGVLSTPPGLAGGATAAVIGSIAASATSAPAWALATGTSRAQRNGATTQARPLTVTARCGTVGTESRTWELVAAGRYRAWLALAAPGASRPGRERHAGPR